MTFRNMLGRCGAIGEGAGAGWPSERDGDDGVVGDSGVDGRAGAEYDRDPRLPPLPARAQASPTCAASAANTMNPIVATKTRPFMVPLPGAVRATVFRV